MKFLNLCSWQQLDIYYAKFSTVLIVVLGVTWLLSFLYLKRLLERAIIGSKVTYSIIIGTFKMHWVLYTHLIKVLSACYDKRYENLGLYEDCMHDITWKEHYNLYFLWSCQQLLWKLIHGYFFLFAKLLLKNHQVSPKSSKSWFRWHCQTNSHSPHPQTCWEYL